jgi:hypothetical protein
VSALILISEKKGQPLAETVVSVLNTPCPAISATVPEYVRLNDDKVSLLTGRLEFAFNNRKNNTILI